MIRLNKAMTLLYLSTGNTGNFTSDTFLTNQEVVLTENYVPMTQMPLAEMRCGEHPVQLVEEVIAMTASTNWRRQSRRPLHCGDIVCRGTDPWVLLNRKEITIPCDGRGVIPLNLWPNYAIYFLDSVTDELKELIWE
jgi:hypothetical protein